MNIVWKRPDGQLSISHLTSEAISPEHEATKLKERGDIPNDWEVAAYAADLPSSREYRNAWIFDGEVKHDMEKAKEIHRALLRSDRSPLLDKLDIEYQRADEVGDNQLKSTIAKKKQVLRDITKDARIASAKSIDDLKEIKVF